MDLGGCGGVLSNGFLIHILHTAYCGLNYLCLCLSVILIHTSYCVSVVESSSVELRTRWNVPQCSNMDFCSKRIIPLPLPFRHLLLFVYSISYLRSLLTTPSLDTSDLNYNHLSVNKFSDTAMDNFSGI